MKKKNVNGKLFLSKETLTNLNNFNNIRGGILITSLIVCVTVNCTLHRQCLDTYYECSKHGCPTDFCDTQFECNTQFECK